MNLLVPAINKSFEAPQKVTKRSCKGLIVVVLIAALLGGAGWYYFFGRKPKVALSIPLPTKGDWHPRGIWAAGPKQVALYANGQLRLVDLADRKEKWSAKIPPQPQFDPVWQQGVNARFVKVQQWADGLAQKRAALTSADQIKAFNAEAAKYHAELTAARAEAAKPRLAAVQTLSRNPDPEPDSQHVLGRDRASVDKLNAVVRPEVRIIEERLKKRATKLEGLKKSLDAKLASAKTELQKSAAKEEDARYQAELAEQKRDQDALEKATGASVPTPARSDVENSIATIIGDFGLSKPQVAICGDRIWLIEAQQAVAFDRASGTVKADVRLAGTVKQVFQGNSTVIVVAAAGAEAVQVTKLSASAPPQSLYLATGLHEYAFVVAENATVPNVQNQRTEFSAANDSLLRADFRLREKKIKVRDAIKQSSEKDLESAASAAAAHSEDELKAISALLANDAARMLGDGKERVDESTYEVTLRRPFEPNVAAWTGTLAGRAQLFSTPTLDLITAGTKLLAFDRSNKKLWEATLGAPVPIRQSDEEWDSLPQPWLESGDRLFFADGAFLTALQSKTGQVLWRLPSVGIRKLQSDDDGNLYVLSDNLHVETLTYVLDASLRDAVPLTMKIKAADGKIAWQREKYQDLWVSGKDVYVFRETKNAADIETQVFDRSKAIEGRVKIYKLSRGNGNPMWEWFQTRIPRAVVAERKSVALLFGDELQIIHSICW